MPNLSPLFFIGNIRIGSVEGASCINLGNNLPVGFQSFKKQNQGFGSITGDNNDISELCSVLKDTNMIDMLNQSGSDEVPGWVKKLAIEKFSKNAENSSKHSI
ncbi:MAG: hypothetical protein APF77_19930 [Clostridia bacterium BRH_c25]|nr:MAG: hypothetical protein APF77_19930 [Clostridia bacterium BRH_c25]